jgi:hypothetical protein
MTFEHPEDRRARRLAAVRAERGTPARLRQIAELEEEKRRRAATRSNSSSGRKTPENSATCTDIRGRSGSPCGMPS